MQAAAGIGEETCYAFAQAGVLGVVFADINYDAALVAVEKSKSFATNPRYRSLAVKVDTSDPNSVQDMVTFTVKSFGRIDYCVNSAGVGSHNRSHTLQINAN